MDLLNRVDPDRLSPASLWSALDEPTREEAARAAYEEGPGSGKTEADMAIAGALRFRPGAVRQLPLERRLRYLVKGIHVDDSLASTLLLALHLHRRTALLECFLESLGIPQRGGLIDEGHDLEPPDEPRLREAVAEIGQRFDAAHVDLYLAALVALDPRNWEGLRAVLAARRER